jgi:hypothetical protein
MPDYRVYPVDKDGHILGVALVVACDSDQEAIEKARSLIKGRDVEVWDGSRLVDQIEADEGQ